MPTKMMRMHGFVTEREQEAECKQQLELVVVVAVAAVAFCHQRTS